MNKIKKFLNSTLLKIREWWTENNYKFPKLLKKSHDGGTNSGVTGYWLIEWKPVFSIVLLRFSKGTRDAFHEHAFNAWTFWIKGEVEEHFQDGSPSMIWTPSIKPKYTPRDNFHMIEAKEVSWALCFRGPWKSTWKEDVKGEMVTLTHGRKVVE